MHKLSFCELTDRNTESISAKTPGKQQSNPTKRAAIMRKEDKDADPPGMMSVTTTIDPSHYHLVPGHWEEKSRAK